jgi:hypothetical protein
MAAAIKSMVETSGSVNVAIKAAQKDFATILIPRQTIERIQTGAILDQCAGRNATKSIAKRQVEMISGNINS